MLVGETCGLPGVKTRDLLESLLGVIRLDYYYPFLSMHMGINTTARHSLEQNIKDYKDLGWNMEDFG